MLIVGSELESFARSYGWETALAVFGINCYWAFCLVVLGGYLLVVEIGSTRSDLQ
jgi:hypothetical protein